MKQSYVIILSIIIIACSSPQKPQPSSAPIIDLDITQRADLSSSDVIDTITYCNLEFRDADLAISDVFKVEVCDNRFVVSDIFSSNVGEHIVNKQERLSSDWPYFLVRVLFLKGSEPICRNYIQLLTTANI